MIEYAYALLSKPSENRMLRQEMEKMVSEIKTKDGMIDEILKINEGQRLKLTEQDMVIREMGRQLTYYENSNSPPSANNLPEQKKKKERRADPKKDMQYSNTGRKKGHPGVTQPQVL